MANKTHENMLSITRYFRNASQNYNEILLHTGQNGYRQKKSTKQKILKRLWRKGTIGGNEN